MEPMTHEEPYSERALYVLTLYAADLPMALVVPAIPELDGTSVFRSRIVEQGREIFRLHLGFFESDVRALEMLALVRPHFPGARISTLPRASLSSLDDTMNTAFRVIRAARSQAPPATAVTPGAPPPPSAPPSSTDPVRYAVELDIGAQPIDANSMTPLAVFKEYNLYTLHTGSPGGREHRLRLGFFRNVDSARQIADYVRADYPQANVVPVSEREHERVTELEERRRQLPDQSMRVRRLDPRRAARAAAPAPAARAAAPAPAAAPPSGEVVYAEFSASELEGCGPEPDEEF